MSEISLIPGGWLGFVKNDAGEEETGLGLALRRGGDEILFGTAVDRAARWIPIEQFYLDPSVVPEVEDVPEGEEEPVDAGENTRPADGNPFTGGIRRRGE